MKPAPFDYVRAGTLDEALASLAQLGDRASVLAGGQSLMPMLNFRVAAPDVLVDIGRIPELAQIRVVGDWIEVGAMVRQATLLAWPMLAQELPLVALALPWVGHFQTRNRGTVCGSIAHADPSSELPLCLATLGGEIELRSASGTRRLGAAQFQTGMLSTARRADELIVAARFPRQRAGEGFAFREVARRHGDFAIVALAAKADQERTLLGAGGMAGQPTVRDFGALAGQALDEALNAFAWGMGGHDDVHATARYRRDLVRKLAPAVIEEARSCRR
jgi:2-furoyl-CoA dehydrogenase FAD binding subunit